MEWPARRSIFKERPRWLRLFGLCFPRPFAVAFRDVGHLLLKTLCPYCLATFVHALGVYDSPPGCCHWFEGSPHQSCCQCRMEMSCSRYMLAHKKPGAVAGCFFVVVFKSNHVDCCVGPKFRGTPCTNHFAILVPDNFVTTHIVNGRGGWEKRGNLIAGCFAECAGCCFNGHGVCVCV